MGHTLCVGDMSYHRQAGPEPAFVYSKATLLYLLQSWVWHCLPGISRDLPDV